MPEPPQGCFPLHPAVVRRLSQTIKRTLTLPITKNQEMTWTTNPNTMCPIAKSANTGKRSIKHLEPGKYLSSLHPAWYVVLAVIFCGARGADLDLHSVVRSSTMLNQTVQRILTINTGSSSLKVALLRDGPGRNADSLRGGRADRRSRGAFASHGRPRRDLDRPEERPCRITAPRWRRCWHGCDSYRPDLEPSTRWGTGWCMGASTTRSPSGSLPSSSPSSRELVPIAPDHLPQAIQAIQVAVKAYPDLPQVACFDTAFHRHMPRIAQLYPLPRHFADEGVDPLRVSRAVLRVHHARTPRDGSERGRGPRPHRPPWQRGEHGGGARRDRHRYDDGFYARWRPHDGHPHRRPRSRRPPVPAGRTGDDAGPR